MHGRNPATHNSSRDPMSYSTTTTKRCYICNNVGHLAKHYNKTKKTESTGGVKTSRTNTLPVTRQVTAQNAENKGVAAAGKSSKTEVTPLEFLLSDSEEDNTVHQVQILDKGSESQCVHVLIQGIPLLGIVNSSRYRCITIIGGDLFRKVSSVPHLKKGILD